MPPRFARRLPAGSGAAVKRGRAGGGASLWTKRLRQKRLGRMRLGLLKDKVGDQPLDEVEKKMFDHELAIARDLQANLLPKQLPDIPGFEISAYYRSSREVGGDYYDFIEVGDHHLGVAIADVSGKGIPGSMVVSETRVLMRSHAAGILSPSETLKRVNRFLFPDIIRGMFVTLFYVILDVKTKKATMTSAGHNPIIYYRAANKSCYLLNPNGIALGIDRGPLFENVIRDQRIQMAVGDRIVLYTDGVIDTFDTEKVAYGLDRFNAAVRANAELSSSEMIKALVADLERYQGGAPQHDDITLVTLRAVPEGSPHDTTFENLL